MEVDQLQGYAELIFAGGAFGLVVWVVQRVFKDTIPRLARDFREALDRQQGMYRDDLRETREAFQDELGAERASQRELIASEREGRERIVARIEQLIMMVEQLGDRLKH
jgi:hypothetical protein